MIHVAAGALAADHRRKRHPLGLGERVVVLDLDDVGKGIDAEEEQAGDACICEHAHRIDADGRSGVHGDREAGLCGIGLGVGQHFLLQGERGDQPRIGPEVRAADRDLDGFAALGAVRRNVHHRRRRAPCSLGYVQQQKQRQ